MNRCSRLDNYKHGYYINIIGGVSLNIIISREWIFIRTCYNYFQSNFVC